MIYSSTAMKVQIIQNTYQKNHGYMLKFLMVILKCVISFQYIPASFGAKEFVAFLVSTLIWAL